MRRHVWRVTHHYHQSKYFFSFSFDISGKAVCTLLNSSLDSSFFKSKVFIMFNFTFVIKCMRMCRY